MRADQQLLGFCIDLELVMLPNGFSWMVKVLLFRGLDQEVVCNKSGGNILRFMAEMSFCNCLLASVLFKSLDKVIVGNFPCLF